jgi:hypothetical protein
MIFAICGLTVVGTGTECAGTSSTGEFSVCACPAGKPAIPAAAHNSAVPPSFHLAKGFPLAGSLIAFSLFVFFLMFKECATTHLLKAFPLQPH